MGSHPVNLGFRFLLEMVAMVGFGIFGWNLGSGLLRYIYAIIIPLFAGALWGTFAVPEDPSRSGSAPVPVGGLLRLFLELLIFFAASLAYHLSGYPQIAYFFGAAVILHYLISYDRIAWLIRR